MWLPNSRPARLVGDELEREGDVAPLEVPVDEVLLRFQILPQRVERRALVGVRRIAVVDEVDEHLVDDRLVLVQPVTQLRQKKSRRLGGGTENALHPLTRQPPQRLLERLVLRRPLELEQVEVAAVHVDVEGIDALRDVFSESDVARHLVGALVELSRQVEQCEVVLLAAAVLLLVLCVRLFEIALRDAHLRLPMPPQE